MTERANSESSKNTGRNRLRMVSGIMRRHPFATAGFGGSVYEIASGSPVLGGLTLAGVVGGAAISEIRSKNTTGFHFEPQNKGADLLEEHLGIRFSDKPRVVDVYGRNAALLRLKEPGLPFQETDAVYLDNYNTVFRSGEEDVQVQLFINMQAYMEKKNPDFASNQEQFYDVLEAMRKGREMIEFDPERCAILDSIYLGMPHLARASVSLHIADDMWARGQDFTQSLSPELVDVVLEHASTGKIDRPKYIPPYGEMETYIHTVTGILSSNESQNRWQDMDSSRKESAVSLRAVGFGFIAEALSRFRTRFNIYGRDFSLANAIDVVIEDPPTTMAEIKEPEIYASRKIDQLLCKDK
jgi:hypothetical protein